MSRAAGAPLRAVAVSELTEAQARKELEALARELAAHDARYYQQSAPAISDESYDALFRRNGEIEVRFPGLVRPDSPAARGRGARDGFCQGRPPGADAEPAQRLCRRRSR